MKRGGPGKRRRKAVRPKVPEEAAFVLVAWDDTWNQPAGWHGRRAARRMKPVKIRSVGYVVRAGRRRLVLAANVCRSAGMRPYSSVTVIPWGSVRSVRELKQGRPDTEKT